MSIWTYLLKNLKWSIRPWHELGLTLAWESFHSQMDPNQVSRLKMSILPVLVGMILSLIIRRLNPFCNIHMKILDLLSSLIYLPTKLS